MAARAPRVGLVLGAGGTVGGAWQLGALGALARETGWEPMRAAHLVGTSAGSVMAAFLAAGTPARAMLPGGERWPLADLADPRAYQAAGPLVPLPGSWRLSATAISQRPRPSTLLRAFSGLVPSGRVSTAAIERTVRRAVPEGWAAHPRCWVIATDYHSGGRVAFGSAGMPEVSLAEAVAASCAIPGFFQPVKLGGRVYVDGGLHSLTNLDLLAGRPLDLAICLSPMSIRTPERGSGTEGLFAALVSRVAAAELDREAALLRRQGVPVLLLEPSAADARIMGTDLMVTGRCEAVVQAATRTVSAALRSSDAARLLAPVRRAA